ncbi:MAG TPA: hypothetical protein VH518_18400, partial [Tepidisphaeraceae bacterium]
EPPPLPSPGVPGERVRVGYIIAHDQYLKRDDLGVIYQLNVVPGWQRKLVGAMLIKSAFERAAYGCRLFCCWCAQDLDANYFWEACGFVPLAFRTGCEKRRRIHIFWQKRIREGDVSTPYWFPSQTKSGAFREDRLVLPIPPGTHWRDVMPIILPRGTDSQPALEDEHGLKTRATKRKPRINRRSIRMGGLRLGEPEDVAAKSDRDRKAKKNDPVLAAAARELRDRWLEQVNNAPLISHGKYEVCRAPLPRPKPPALTVVA